MEAPAKPILPDGPVLSTMATIMMRVVCQNRRVLEIGSGGSTIWLADIASNVTSIETNPAWYEAVATKLQEKKANNVVLRLVEEAVIRDCYHLMQEHMHDVIFIDCEDRFRKGLLHRALQTARPDVFIVVDDSHWGQLKSLTIRATPPKWMTEVMGGYKMHPIRNKIVRCETTFIRRCKDG